MQTHTRHRTHEYFTSVSSLFLRFQSETCSLSLPSLDFEMGGHALGGRFTTLEGLLKNVQDQLENNPFLGTGKLLVHKICSDAIIRIVYIFYVRMIVELEPLSKMSDVCNAKIRSRLIEPAFLHC